MSAIRAVVVEPGKSDYLALREVEAPNPLPSEAVVQVAAISLNRGEVRRAADMPAGARIGWDLAGTVIQQAADGSGPRVGSRVVGLVSSGAWAEQVAISTSLLAEIPDKVTFAQAATLPVAGLTALRALAKGGFLLKQPVLITGTTGGVGHLAVQLARLAGAYIVGVSRTPERAAFVREAGAHEVIVGEDIAAASQFGPYHLILDSVGGKVLSTVFAMLEPGGICVNFGASESRDATLSFSPIDGVTLYRLYLFGDLARKPGAPDLALLARMIAAGELRPQIDVEAPWTDISTIAQRLLKREFTGKAVLHLT